MAKLTKKQRQDIAQYINSIMVSNLMIQDGFDRDIWQENENEAVIKLFLEHGIELPSYKYIARIAGV